MAPMEPAARYKYVMLLIGLLLVAFCLFFFLSRGKTVPVMEQERENPPEEITGEKSLADLPFRCPLDGTPLAEMPLRPLAVVIDNYAAARPQSGLDRADLVYEIPAEGGITRFLALYFHGEAGTLGPVRSARPYLASLAQDWDAVFIHAGESPQAQIYFKKENIDHLNEMFHPQGFWRDKSRQAPNNLYTGTRDLWTEIGKKGWDRKTEVPAFTFRDQGEEPEGSPEATEVKVHYPYSQVIYRYDAGRGLYLRSLGSKPHQDKETGEQLTAANLIVQRTRIRAFDAEGRLEIELAGEGEALFFSGGSVQKGKWKKESGHRPARFYDGQGEEFRLQPGQTWILIVPENTVVEY